LGLGSWVFLSACGKVGDPLPPAPRLPLRTKDLAVTQRGPFLWLRWPNPNVQSLESLGFNLRRIDVYRLIEPLNNPDPLSEDEFAERAALIGSVDEPQIRATATSEELIYRDGPISQWSRRYRYAIRYVSTRGQSAALSNIVPIIPSPRVADAPAQVQVRDQSQGVVSLAWNAPAANIDGSSPPVVIGYNVYRRPRTQIKFGLPINGATPILSPGFLDRQFDYETEYVYAVRAISRSASGDVIESDDSEPVVHTPRDAFPPAAPENVTAGSANAVISLFWTGNSESDLAGYNIYRAERADAPESEWVKLNPLLHTLTTFRDESPVRGKTYFYKLTAVDRAGNVSPPSAIVEQEAQ
jgi:hypothetical protein